MATRSGREWAVTKGPLDCSNPAQELCTDVLEVRAMSLLWPFRIPFDQTQPAEGLLQSPRKSNDSSSSDFAMWPDTRELPAAAPSAAPPRGRRTTPRRAVRTSGHVRFCDDPQETHALLAAGKSDAIV
jgi:hypothetical protein